MGIFYLLMRISNSASACSLVCKIMSLQHLNTAILQCRKQIQGERIRLLLCVRVKLDLYPSGWTYPGCVGKGLGEGCLDVKVGSSRRLEK
jgi:hypothetical protein